VDGLAVKTTGPVASGAITESLILARLWRCRGFNTGRVGDGHDTTVKVFIDVFIAIWAFILACIWSTKIRNPIAKASGRVRSGALPQVHSRLHGDVRGDYRGRDRLPATGQRDQGGDGQANVFRGIFFVMTFFTIGVVSNFRRSGGSIGKLALVYVICLFGFIIWIGLLISWLFFGGVMPPVAG